MTSISLPIRIGSVKIDGLLQSSKWLKVQVFLDGEEMQALIRELEPLFFVVVSEPVRAE
jgi:hypothetical protein